MSRMRSRAPHWRSGARWRSRERRWCETRSRRWGSRAMRHRPETAGCTDVRCTGRKLCRSPLHCYKPSGVRTTDADAITRVNACAAFLPRAPCRRRPARPWRRRRQRLGKRKRRPSCAPRRYERMPVGKRRLTVVARADEASAPRPPCFVPSRIRSCRQGRVSIDEPDAPGWPRFAECARKDCLLRRSRISTRREFLPSIPRARTGPVASRCAASARACDAGHDGKRASVRVGARELSSARNSHTGTVVARAAGGDTILAAEA